MSSTSEDTGICPSCEQAIPADRLTLHLAGLDGARPECPRQDLVAIVNGVREEEYSGAARWRRARTGAW
jgi:hypothetical protein